MEGVAQTIGGFSPLFLLMLEYRVPYVLIYRRNQRGEKIAVITVLNYLRVWFKKLAGNTFPEGQELMSSEEIFLFSLA